MVGRFGWRDACIFALAVLVAWGLYRGFATQIHLTQEGKQAHDALCASRANTVAAVRSTEQYLADVKAGVRDPIVGITAKDINQGLARQRLYVKALAPLRCH